MATRKARAILRTSDTGRGRIYSSLRNTQDTRVLMVARRSTMPRAAMPVVITPSTWSRESSSDTDVDIDQLHIQRRNSVMRYKRHLLMLVVAGLCEAAGAGDMED